MSSTILEYRHVASKQPTVDFLLKQIVGTSEISAKKMFGEYGLYCSQKLFGLVCDNQFFLKPTPGGRALLGDDLDERSPYPGAKPYLAIRGDIWEDAARLTALAMATVAELPTLPAKKARQSGAPRR